MTLLERLRRRQQQGVIAPIAVVGTGFLGRGLIGQLQRTPGLRPALIVSRRPKPAVRGLADAGYRADEILISDNAIALREAVRRGQPAVTRRADLLTELPEIVAVVEATGAVEYGAQVALHAISARQHVIMVNAETDATVGPALRWLSDEAGVVYTGADGDQPAVLKRLVDFAEWAGLRTIAAMNCKGFMDVHATPRSILEWSRRQGTSLKMTTAFTDGTKLNLENAVLSNATGLLPACRGMVGVPTSLETAVDDCLAAIETSGVVDYTLGGDFGSGVFLVVEGEDPRSIQPFMQYFKLGEGPCYMLYRPYHLCHLEVCASIAEAVLDEVATITPAKRETEVVAVAKRDLVAGQHLDGIGGFTCYGQIDVAGNAGELLPIGLTDDAVLVRDVRRDEPIELDAVQLDDRSTLLQLRELLLKQEHMGFGRRTAA